MALFIAALVIWFIVRVVDVLLLVFVAILLAVYLSAITDWLEQRRFGLRRWMGLLTAVFATIVIIAGVAVLLVPPVIDQTEALIGGLPQTLTKIQNVLAGWARQYPVLDRTELADPSSGLVASFVNDAMGFVRGSFLGTIRGGGKLFIEGASVVVMGLYLTSQPNLYRNGLISLVVPRRRPIAVRILQDLGATLKAWVVG